MDNLQTARTYLNNAYNMQDYSLLLKSVEIYTDIITKDNDYTDEEPYLVLGYLFWQIGDNNKALIFLDTANKISPFNFKISNLIKKIKNESN